MENSIHISLKDTKKQLDALKNAKAMAPFAMALSYLLNKEGHGSKKKCAAKLGISSGYLSELANGKKEGSFKVRETIAEYFGMKYGKMEELGESLSSDAKASDSEHPPLSLKQMSHDIGKKKFQADYEMLSTEEKYYIDRLREVDKDGALLKKHTLELLEKYMKGTTES